MRGKVDTMKKCMIFALLTCFLLQAQAFASPDYGRDILAGNSRQSIPGEKEREKARPPAREIQEEPQTPANRERDILSGKAQRSIPTEKKKKEKKQPSESGKKIALKEEPMTEKEREREILSGKAQRSTSAMKKKVAKNKPPRETNLEKPEETPRPDADKPKGAEQKGETQEPPSSRPVKDAKPSGEGEKPKAAAKPSEPAKERPTPKLKRPDNQPSAADREREILSGKAQRSTRAK